MLHNRELRWDVIILLTAAVVLSGAGSCISPACGIFACIAGLTAFGVHFALTAYRYRRLRKLSEDLDRLLYSGTPMPIREYMEGELSVLANQVQKLARHLAEAAEASKSDKLQLADALANISHQLRTPLTAMNLTATMLSDPALTPQRRQELTMELKNLLSRTDWLVETLLKLSKMDAGTVKLASEQVAISKLIDQASSPLLIPMELREQKLIVSCGTEQFAGDLTWTAEALGNVLKNCMEHTPTGGSVTVTAEETALYTQITVQDTGPGFAPKDIPHLFERFYKGTNAVQNSYGIGLALARTVISAQNGTVQASNTPAGARFVIKFYKQNI